MIIRKACAADMECILDIYEKARVYMCASGNPDQWKNGYPARSLLEEDIQKENAYVCCTDGSIAGSFYFAVEEEASYKTIKGAWLNNEPYGLIHRLASVVYRQGIAGTCLQWCFDQIRNIRIDTHKNNLPMRSLLKKHGYHYCGTIRLADGSARMAYQKTSNS